MSSAGSVCFTSTDSGESSNEKLMCFTSSIFVPKSKVPFLEEIKWKKIIGVAHSSFIYPKSLKSPEKSCLLCFQH